VRWSHVALNCARPAVTERFYSDWFGFRRARVVALEDGEIVFLRNGDAYLELFAVGGDPPAPAAADGSPVPGTPRHLAFQTDDVDALLAAMGDQARISLGPLDFDEFLPGWRSVWITDPDGVVVEVSQGFRDEHVPTTSEQEHRR